MTRQYRNAIVNGSVVAMGLALAAPAAAASLEQLPQSEWWSGEAGLPSYVNMYLYVPDQRVESPPVVVAPHHCQGTGPGTFSEMSSLVSIADQNGFILIFPEATGQNCWDAGSARSLAHDGGGDTHAIVQMVRYTLATYGGNPARVYSVGGSSGGIITEALLAVYPDVFMAGVSYMGVPAGCWATGYNDVVGTPANGTGQWSGPCAGGNVIQSAQAWGDLARSFFPGYTGHRPRLQHWHGTADTTISPQNLTEDIKQWTNVLGASETPAGTDTPSSGTTRQYWASSCGYVVYETFSLAGVGHAVPFDGNSVAAYFGLGASAGPDPEAAACAAAAAEALAEPPASDGGAPGGGAPVGGANGSLAPLSPSATSGDEGANGQPPGEVTAAVAPQAAPAGGPLDEPGGSSLAGPRTNPARGSGSCAFGAPSAAGAATPVLSVLLGCTLLFLRRRRERNVAEARQARRCSGLA